MSITIHHKIAPSATVKINTLAQQKKAAGIEIFNFAAGDPVIPNHPLILEGIKKELEKGLVPYAQLPGIPSLRKAMAAWMNQEYGSTYEPQNILVTCGGKFALFAALQALVEKGEEVLIAAPYWPSYPEMVTLCGGTPKIIATDSLKGWKLSVEDLKKHATGRTRVLIFNNGCNPTGVVYTKEEIEALLQTAQELNLAVISDEVYSALVYDSLSYVSCGSFKKFSDRVLVVQSCSKNFAMAGWRVGFACGPASLIQAMSDIQGQTTTGTSLVSQWAATAALENSSTITAHLRQEMKKRRDLFIDLFNDLFEAQLPKPASALYAFIPIEIFNRNEVSSAQVCETLLKEANVAAVPGIAFGQEGYLRMAFSESLEQIEKGLHSLKGSLQ